MRSDLCQTRSLLPRSRPNRSADDALQRAAGEIDPTAGLYSSFTATPTFRNCATAVACVTDQSLDSGRYAMKSAGSRLSKSLRIGDTTTKVLPSLVRSLSSVKRITLVTIPRPPSVSDRLRNDSRLARLVQQASGLSKHQGLSLWSTILLGVRIGNETDDQDVSGLLRSALFHVATNDALSNEDIASADLTPKLLQNRAGNGQPDRLVALSSRVSTHDGGRMHLPLLDFSLPHSNDNTKIVAHAADQLGLPYAVLGTTHSYHYYGLQVLPAEQYLGEFLGRALLLAPIVDARWIAHQLMDGLATLRVSPDSRTGQESVLVCGSPWN
jgi:hypothetical protein